MWGSPLEEDPGLREELAALFRRNKNLDGTQFTTEAVENLKLELELEKFVKSEENLIASLQEIRRKLEKAVETRDCVISSLAKICQELRGQLAADRGRFERELAGTMKDLQELHEDSRRKNKRQVEELTEDRNQAVRLFLAEKTKVEKLMEHIQSQSSSHGQSGTETGAQMQTTSVRTESGSRGEELSDLGKFVLAATFIAILALIFSLFYCR